MISDQNPGCVFAKGIISQAVVKKDPVNSTNQGLMVHVSQAGFCCRCEKMYFHVEFERYTPEV